MAVKYLDLTGLTTYDTLLKGYITDNYQPLNDILSSISGMSGSSTGLIKLTNGVASFDTNNYLTGITSSMVTTALGYTPYNSTNPNNYTSVVESTVSGWGFTKNTGTVIGSDLTADYFALGNGAVNVKISTMKPTTSSTTWSATSDVNVPTMKAISSYVTGLGYTKNTGTVTSVGAGTGLSITGTASVNPTVNIASGYKLPTTTEWTNVTTAIAGIPTKTSDLNNDSGFITSSVNNLTNYYKKTETYTQSEVDALISTIPKFAIEVVNALPTTDISTTTVYLLKTSTTEIGNLYTEYIYVNNAWESLGTQTLDLSNYLTTNENQSGLTGSKSWIGNVDAPYVSVYSTTLQHSYVSGIHYDGFVTKYDSNITKYAYGSIKYGSYTLTLPSATGTIALTSNIPTNNNQLTNGAGYITASYLTAITETEINSLFS